MAAIEMKREQIDLLLEGTLIAALEEEADFIVQHRARRERQAFVGHLLRNDVFENVSQFRLRLVQRREVEFLQSLEVCLDSLLIQLRAGPPQGAGLEYPS